ncbi:hypothetical protein ACIHCQ_00475 [Streptomyces sp. NPDC052236]|uniref:nSTAND1 domain-containing NTPase n=1 Tax=Streptomyces sp. NPDC052236 TaxID=3365686 RepID=UPI0037D8D499
MGRREKPLDPAAGPVQRFAYELRKLREEAGGPTYRAMAQRTDYSAPTLSAAAAGERLPSQAVALAYAAACGGEPADWERRWRQASAEEAADQAAGADHDRASSPYPGLGRFGTDDRERFFGRDDLIADLVELTGRRRFAALVGASGSGKSSLLRAGLVPALRTGQEPLPAAIRVLTPGEHPARTHKALLTDDAVVLVDQFEEVFTLCHDPAERAEFIELLLGSGARVVIAVRADFYGRCAEHHGLADALRDATLLVGPMAPARLREAIVGPATVERLIVERALTARIVADVADEPGGLPLMSHALLETWRRRRGRTLTVAAYESIGGVQGAIAHTAEEIFTGFSEAQARTARALLLRLVSPGDGTQDTRRPAHQDELARLDGPVDSAAVLERLVRARLLTTDAATVNLAHEALITAWPRLRGWIEADRERLRLHRRLTESARMWEVLGRDAGALYRGTQLAAASEAFAAQGTRHAELTVPEGDFLTASLEAHDREQRAAARTTHRLRGLTVTLSVLLCLAVVAGLVAWQQSRTSARQAEQAEARRVAAVAGTLRQSDPVNAMRLSLAAWRVADLPETREALFGAAAQRDLDLFTVADASQFPLDDNTADNSVWARLSQDGRIRTVVGPDRTDRWDMVTRQRLPSFKGLGPHAGRIDDVSRDTRTVAVRTPQGVRIWDLAAGRLTGPAFGPSGDAHEDAYEGGFAPTGRTFVVQSHSRAKGGPTVELWDARNGRLLLMLEQRARRTEVSPDDRLLASCGDDGRMQIWDVRERRRLHTPWADKDRAGQKLCDLQDFEFTPDSRGLGVTTDTGLLTWDVRSGRERPRITVAGLSEAEFSESGDYAATIAAQEIQLWRTADPSAPVLRHRLTGGNVSGLALDLKGGVLRYVEGDNVAGAIRTVALDGAVEGVWEQQPFTSARFSPDGSALATTTVERGKNHEVQLRDGGTGRLRAAFPSAVCDTCARIPVTAFSPDGRAFAHVNASATVTVRSTDDVTGTTGTTGTTGVTGFVFGGRSSLFVSHSPDDIEERNLTEHTSAKLPRKRYGTLLAQSPDGHLLTDEHQLIGPGTGRTQRVLPGESAVKAVAFSPDGRYLAMADHYGRVTLWDGHGENRLALLRPAVADPGARPDWRIPALAFSPDSRTVAVGDADGAVRLWDTASPRAEGSPLPPANGAVLALAFDADSSHVRVTTPHVAVRSYPLAPERTAEAVCARAGGGLSRDAWKTYLPTVAYRDTCHH